MREKPRIVRTGEMKRTARFPWRGLIAGGIVVIGAGAIFLMVMDEPEAGPTNTAKVKPRAKTVETVWSDRVETTHKTDLSEQEVLEEKKSINLRDPRLTPTEREAAYVQELADTPLPDSSSNRLFRTGLEQVMGWIFTTEVGDMPPPLPLLDDFDLVHLEEILNSKNEITDADSDQQPNEKEIVDNVKEELKKYLDEGGSPEKFLTYYHDQLRSAFMRRQAVENQAIELYERDPDLADEFLDTANSELEKDGIKAATIPRRTRLRLDSLRGRSR